MKNPGLGKTARAAGMSDSRGGASPAKLAGYYEYDKEGNKKQITTEEWEKRNKEQGSTLTAGKASEKGYPGSIVADMSHGKAEIDQKAEKDNLTGAQLKEYQKGDKYKKDVEEGEKARGQRGTGKKTTRYAKDQKKQAEFDKKKKAKAEGGSATPRKKY